MSWVHRFIDRKRETAGTKTYKFSFGKKMTRGEFQEIVEEISKKNGSDRIGALNDLGDLIRPADLEIIKSSTSLKEGLAYILKGIVSNVPGIADAGSAERQVINNQALDLIEAIVPDAIGQSREWLTTVKNKQHLRAVSDSEPGVTPGRRY